MRNTPLRVLIMHHALDILRSLLSFGLLLSTILGWKALWDLQITNGLSWYISVGIGNCIYIIRHMVDDVMDTHHVHNEEWLELFSKLPDLSPTTILEYGKIYLSSGLLFVSRLFIWRGIWKRLDATQITWPESLMVGAISCVFLSIMQLQVDRKRVDILQVSLDVPGERHAQQTWHG
ncbi:hypothetical protein GUITHDRAFT_118303 [Guillardia theta CCMP2712]|uniref:Uncharacterized protein n=1 Tax=Guillardia theta (strain CCMP2712) TaxID=905079 RepID=L1IHR9_GUITC|nr:hypothetical protein GUITHDRAFT_118303 [Guillardia theta CCMP2712]EKX35489.1 hypothetical protein GUITHDRAFT_118303 [Guillardia theta CCMP2712]|eukprot:XP_005822469.1 hypothetical protein GUITHDRAFT_118303 [Guillardia theta CCMP2712]